ncbi:MAG: CmcJ/NvfI family oxidoreductase [Pseudomonadota bacterium]
MRNSEFKVELKYLAAGENNAQIRPSVAGGEQASEQGEFSMHLVEMHSARGLETSLDREGFVVAEHQTRVTDFYDDQQIADVYEDEIAGIVTRTCSAAKVVIFDHTRRASSVNTRQARNIREHASTIHNDYDAESGLQRLREINPSLADQYAQKRFAIVNVWRSINGDIENYPLSFCDASSVSPDDLVSVQRVAKDRVGALQLARHNPNHRWLYFPHMSGNELLLFKVFDSAEDGRARFTIHTSFDDPTALSNAKPRESIETRCFVFFDGE